MVTFSFISSRFGGAQHHHYMLNFLKSVAEYYHGDGRAGDLVVDLLKLEVPKLFAVEEGGEKIKAEDHEFSVFLRDYICRCNLKLTILGKMDAILVRNFGDAFSVYKHELIYIKLHKKYRNYHSLSIARRRGIDT